MLENNNAMTGRRPFGRRVDQQRAGGAVEVARESAVPDAPVSAVVLSAASAPADREFEEWKKARRQNFRLPWRQLYFLATLFFGIASLALPDSVNEEVGWLLYALMAASLCAGFAARRRKGAS